MAVDRVLVAGAGGGTGRQVLRVLGRSDRTVRATTHSPRKLPELEPRADEVVVADLLDRADATRAVEGVDAVVTTVGSSPWRVLRARFGDRALVDGRGNVNLVDAATAAGAEQFAMQSSLGVAGDRASWLARSFRLAVAPALAAKAEAEAALRESGLRYTILRPGVLTNGAATRDAQVAPAGTGLWGTISRADVAELLVASLRTPAAVDRTLEVVHNPLQRRAALGMNWRWA